jgi:hypothetical protein
VVNFKERFDVFLAIGLERAYTEEECVALGALAKESCCVAATLIDGSYGPRSQIDHPVVNFWCALNKVWNTNANAERNVHKVHKHIASSIVEVSSPIVKEVFKK